MNYSTVVRLVAVLISALSAHEARSEIRFVDAAAPPGGDGLTWRTAFQHLQYALDVNVPNLVSEIRIAAGTYRPDRVANMPGGSGDRALSFAIPSGRTIRGGYAGLSGPDPDERDIVAFPTVLSGDLSGNDGPMGTFTNMEENSFHVVKLVGVSNIVLDGLQIVSGHANVGFNDQNGAGVYASAAEPITFVDCRFEGNVAVRDGGGAYWKQGGACSFTRCVFVGNRVNDGRGAGLQVINAPLIIEECLFTGNHAIVGSCGGLDWSGPDLLLRRSTFINNTAGNSGGGASIVGGKVTLESCEFVNNSTTTRHGGGLYADGAHQDTWRDCVFIGNTAGDAGGGLHLSDANRLVLLGFRFENNHATRGGAVWGASNNDYVFVAGLFKGNVATQYGGAIMDIETSRLELYNTVLIHNSAGTDYGAIGDFGHMFMMRNCTVAGNSAARYAGVRVGGLYQEGQFLENNVVWGNTAATNPTLLESQLQMNQYGYSPNIVLLNNVVQFAPAGFGSRTLTIDPRLTDLTGGDVRLLVGSPAIDSGFGGAICGGIRVDADLHPRFMDGDADGVARVDRGAFEFPGLAGPDGDANCDGIVDINDLFDVIRAWGPCPTPFYFYAHCPADINDDIIVNVTDLLSVVQNWSPR